MQGTENRMVVISWFISGKKRIPSTVRFHNIITRVQHLSFLECRTDMIKLDQKEDARTATNYFTFLRLENTA